MLLFQPFDINTLPTKRKISIIIRFPFVCQDGILYNAPTVFDNLIAKRELPVIIGIFIQPGGKLLKADEQPAKRPDGRPASRANRSVEYDTLSDTYARFLMEEILPEVGKKYNLTKTPKAAESPAAAAAASARSRFAGSGPTRSANASPPLAASPTSAVQQVLRTRPQLAKEADPHVPAGRCERSRQPVRFVAGGEQGNGRRARTRRATTRSSSSARHA